jgi:hypothetical protein
MSRRIVFAGGSQNRALARLYRSEIAGRVGDEVIFIGSGAVGTDAAQSTLLLADLIVMEIDEDGDTVPARLLPSNVDLIRAPNLYCDFLWPFAGSAHPRNRGAFVLPGGPYPGEHGDRFLDRMVAEGVDEDEAIRRYLAIDMEVEGELDSRLTDRLAIMQRLDLASGFDLAGYVADHFRTQALFTTRQRLTMPMLRPLAAQLFAKMGVAGFDLSKVRRLPFPSGAQPLHPAVIAHFGLTYAQPGQAYPFNDEGFFTFDAFCRRYMRFEWNEVLHKGIQTAKTDPANAVADLEAGLAISPDSLLGRQALEVARHAAGLEPGPAPDNVIDEDSYDVAALQAVTPVQAAPLAPEPPEAVEVVAEAEPFADAEPEPEIAADVPPEAVEADLVPAAAAEAEPPEDDAPVLRQFEQVDPSEAPAVGYAAILRRKAEELVPEQGTAAHGFTDFAELTVSTAVTEPAEPESNFIDVLPRMLPGFADIAAAAADRPFSIMAETMPPPPLRPILPPELQGEPERVGFFSRLLGRRAQ